jgi:hypothetical protein
MKTTQKDMNTAGGILLAYREEIETKKALVIVNLDTGKGLTDYLRVTVASPNENGRVELHELTWAISKVFGYSLRDRHGWNYVALGGYGYDKCLHLITALETFYNMKGIRWTRG